MGEKDLAYSWPGHCEGEVWRLECELGGTRAPDIE